MRMMTDKDVADMLGVHRATVWRWASEGRLPKPVRPLGARIARWKADEVEAAINASAA